MSYQLTNISGGLIVCDLNGKGNTLRLNNRATKTIKETEITPHIENLVNKGLILKMRIEGTTKTKTTMSSKREKEKEE